MTDQVQQLISKAMSTTSEDEAIACLKMARKKNNGKTVNYGGSSSKPQQPQQGTFNGQTAEYWYVKAYRLHRELYAANSEMTDLIYQLKKARNKSEGIQSTIVFWRTLACGFGLMIPIILLIVL